MPAIGITGGISTGKTSFCECLREIVPAAKFFDADQVAHQLVDLDPQGNATMGSGVDKRAAQGDESGGDFETNRAVGEQACGVGRPAVGAHLLEPLLPRPVLGDLHQAPPPPAAATQSAPPSRAAGKAAR